MSLESVTIDDGKGTLSFCQGSFPSSDLDSPVHRARASRDRPSNARTGGTATRPNTSNPVTSSAGNDQSDVPVVLPTAELPATEAFHTVSAPITGGVRTRSRTTTARSSRATRCDIEERERPSSRAARELVIGRRQRVRHGSVGNGRAGRAARHWRGGRHRRPAVVVAGERCRRRCAARQHRAEASRERTVVPGAGPVAAMVSLRRATAGSRPCSGGSTGSV